MLIVLSLLPLFPFTLVNGHLSVEEMKAFIGILILIGTLKLAHLEMFWSPQDPLIATPGIANVMSRVRFQQLFQA